MNWAGRWFAKSISKGLTTILLVASSLACGAPPPIEHFTRLPAIDAVVVSPSGNRLALLVFSPAGRRSLAVMNLDPIGEARVVGAFDDADIQSAHWVSDDRLIYEAYQRTAEIREGGAGTFAVNHDGSASRPLIAWRYAMNETSSTIRSRILPYGWFFHSTVDDGSPDVFVYRRVDDRGGDLKHIQLARLNTNSGVLNPLSYGMPEGTRQWYMDEKREPRLVSAYREGRQKVFWRPPGADSWSEVADFDPLNDPAFTPWLIDAGGEILVTGRLGGDTSGIFRFDPVAKRIDPEPLVRVSGFDLSPVGEVDTKTGRLIGLHFKADRPMSYWFDAKLEAIQRGIDAALPAGRSNQLYCGRCESTRFIVIRSSSDRQPGTYFLFDRSNSSLQPIGASRPWIEEPGQGGRRLHRVTTRDGLSIPVYVTSPAGAAQDKALPAVLLVHGGPWVRGTDLTWQAEAQFLASRGYRVIEPEFRGSQGYGFRLFRAGWKEWGHAMQDDLVDAVEWATKQGLIDRDRVCIVGSSYGGYAALMAPIAHPVAYRCAVSFAGVTDIELMYSISWSDISQAARQYSMPVLIGDPVQDADRLAKASPLKRVAEIKVPVLLTHGAADRRVPIAHAQKFGDAAKRAGVNIEQVIYTGVGHGFVDPAKQAEHFGRVERFLDNSLRQSR